MARPTTRPFPLLMSAASLPTVARFAVRLNNNGATYTIYRNGEIACDPQEGLPLDNIASKSAADRIVNRMKAF